MSWARTFCLMLCVVATGGCGQQVALESLASETTAELDVVVIWSTANSLYREPTRAFAEQLRDEANVWKAELPANRRAMRHAISGKAPDLLLALGTRAALFAREEFPDTPTLFAMVVDYQRHGVLTAPNVMGIALEVPTHHEFTQFKIVIPSMDHVVAFYTEQTSPALLESSETALRELGIELISHRVADVSQIPEDFATATAAADAVWLLNDPSIMTSASFDFLRRATRIHQLPFLCSLSRRFTEHGALMSVSVDFGSLGFQAASMTRSYLQTGEAQGVQPPIGTEFVVNLETSDAIGLEIPPETFFVADEILHLEGEPEETTSLEPSAPPVRGLGAKGTAGRSGSQ